MSKLEEMKEMINDSKKKVIKKAKEKAKKVKDTVSHGAVKVATAATLASGVGGMAAETYAQNVDKDGSTQMAKELNYQYAHNNNLHFRPITEAEAAMLGGTSQNGGGRTASFTAERQRMSRTQQAQETDYGATRGAQRRVASGPVWNGVELQYDPIYSDGLRPEYVGAYINPNEDYTMTSYVYFYKMGSHGPIFSGRCTVQQAEDHYRNGTSQYCVRHREGWGGYFPGGAGGYGVSGGNVGVHVGRDGVGVSVGGSGRRGAGQATVHVGRNGSVSVNVGGFRIGGRGSRR